MQGTKRRVFRTLSLLLAMCLLAVGVPMTAQAYSPLEDVFPQPELLEYVLIELGKTLGSEDFVDDGIDKAKLAAITGPLTLAGSGAFLPDGLEWFPGISELKLIGYDPLSETELLAILAKMPDGAKLSADGYISVDSITIEIVPSTPTVNAGTPVTVKATVLPADATFVDSLNFALTDDTIPPTGATLGTPTQVDNVYTVEVAGAKSSGTVTVTASIANISAESDITFAYVPVGGVTMDGVTNQTNGSGAISGGTYVPAQDKTLGCLVSPANASYQDVTWSIVSGHDGGTSIADNILTVSAAETTNPLVVRATIVNALSGGVTGTYDFNLAKKFEPVTSITLDNSTVNVNDTLTLLATVLPEDASFQDITWSLVSAPGGATVNLTPEGEFTAGTLGTYRVKASIANGLDIGTAKEAEFDIEVTFIPATALEDVYDRTASPGETITLACTVVPEDATYRNGVQWEVVSATGVAPAYTFAGNSFRPDALGTYTLRAYLEQPGITPDLEATFKIVVENIGVSSLYYVPGGVAPEVPLDLGGVKVNPSNATHKENEIIWTRESVNNVTVAPATATPSNPFVATLTGGNTAGSYVIKATIPGGKADGSDWSELYTINVASVGVDNIALDATLPFALIAGQAATTVNATVSPTNAVSKKIEWTVSSAAGLECTPQDANGSQFTLRGLKAGSYTLMATIVGGKKNGSTFEDFTLTWQVNVTNIAVTGVTLTGAPLTLIAPAGGVTESLIGAIEPSTSSAALLLTPIDWTVANPGTTGAEMDIDGVTLKVKQAGTVTVTATVPGGQKNGGVYTETFTIVVKNVAAESVNDWVPSDVVKTVYAKAPVPLDLLPATVQPTDATKQAVTWKVTAANGTGAAIDADGTFTANTRGTGSGLVTIQATIKGGAEDGKDKTFDYQIEVRNRAVIDITPNPNPFVVTANKTLTLRGDITPTDATNKVITWSVPANSIGATIDGVSFKATSPGTVMVKATVNGGKEDGLPYTQDFEVMVLPVPVTDITGVPTTDHTGEAMILNATPPIRIMPNTTSFTPADIVWTCTVQPGSGDPLATAGKFTPDTPGSYTLLATIPLGKGDGATDFTKTFDITVANIGVQKIKITYVTIGTGATDFAPVATIEPANATNKTIAWVVSDANGTGAAFTGSILNAGSEGAIKVLATIAGGKADGSDYTQEFAVNISDSHIEGIANVPATAKTGQAVTLSTTIIPSTVDKPVVWSVLDAGTTGATVENNVLTALRPGTVTLRATVTGGNEDGTDWVRYYDVVVTGGAVNPELPGGNGDGQPIALPGVKVYVRKNISVAVGGATLYASNNTKVAEVDDTGKVLGKRPGTAVLTILANGETYQQTVTVKYNFWQWLLVIFLFGWLWVPLK